MKAKLYHMQLNVSKKSLLFYRELLRFLDYKIIDESKDHIGASDGSTDLWIIKTEGKYSINGFHRKNTGVNHLAFKVKNKKDVDQFYKKFLIRKKIKVLYNSPKFFPKYSKDYYAVFFEDPERIKLEVVSI